MNEKPLRRLMSKMTTLELSCSALHDNEDISKTVRFGAVELPSVIIKEHRDRFPEVSRICFQELVDQYELTEEQFIIKAYEGVVTCMETTLTYQLIVKTSMVMLLNEEQQVLRILSANDNNPEIVTYESMQ